MEEVIKKLAEYANLVKEMRKAQKKYFAAQYGSTEKGKALDESKELEKKVDKFELPIDSKGNLVGAQKTIF